MSARHAHARTPKHSGTEVMSNRLLKIQYNFAVRERNLILSDLITPIEGFIHGEGRLYILLSRRQLELYSYFDILLTVHLNIFILILNNLMH